MWLHSVHACPCIMHLREQFGMVDGITKHLLMCSFSFQESKLIRWERQTCLPCLLAEHCAQKSVHSCLGRHFHTLIIRHHHVATMFTTVASPGSI